MIRSFARVVLALFYAVAGVFHLIRPAQFLAITPHWVPAPALVVLFTGLAELAGAAALIQPWSKPLRAAGGIGLALYAIGVFPANINHMFIDMARTHPQLGWGYHIPRMFAQPVLVWAALYLGEVIEWPWRRAARSR